jgi:hypothetical protein
MWREQCNFGTITLNKKPLGELKHLTGMVKSGRKQQGSGRLVPQRPTGVVYRVKYGMRIIDAGNQHGRGVRPLRWERLSVRPIHSGRIPMGDYFLHADEGGVFQVKLEGNKWQYLAAA